MTITRRRFTQGALSAGLLSAIQAPRLGAANGAPGVPKEVTVTTFHFDLGHYDVYAKHTLHVGTRRYFLLAHTPETRLAARLLRPGLRLVPDSRLSHYADDVEVSATGVQRIHVRTNHPVRRHGVSLVAMHIPAAARARARLARNLALPPGSAAPPDECTQKDQFEDNYLTGRSTAKAIITHHPDLFNLDPDTAATMETHMDFDQAAAVDNLAISICLQGPAWEHDPCDHPPPCFADGWAVLVPMYNGDGTKLLDTDGQQIFDYQFSEQTGIDMQPAITALLASVKNDRSLNGEQYDVIYHGDPVDIDALPPALPPVLDSNQAQTLRAARGKAASTGESVTFSTLGYHHNILFYRESYSSTDRSFYVQILNLNFIWYGVYLEYLDGDGVPLALPNRSSFLNELVANGLDLETDTLKFWDLLSPPSTIFGLPTPVPYGLSLSLPDGASQVRINLIGPGAYGALPYGPAVVPGVALTVLLGYAIPIYFMVNGAGLDENKTLSDLFVQKGTIIKTLLLYSQEYSLIAGSAMNSLGVAGSLVSVIDSLVQDAALLNIKSSVPDLWKWLTSKLAEEEAAEATPFAGWVIRIMALLGTAAAIVTTTAEVLSNPLVISNTVSFTHPVTVVVSHDPNDFEFPLIATHFEVEITVGAKALEPPTVVAISDADRSRNTLTAVVANVPSTGAEATVSVLFRAANGYPIASSATVDAHGVPILDGNGDRIPGDIKFMNKLPQDGSDLIVQVPIVENPVPITAETLYTHHHKLGFANGRYFWNYTPVPPALEAPSCGAGSGLCDLGNVTVWVPGGMIGYSWVASSPSIRACATGAAGQLYNFQNLSLKNDPNAGRKTPGCGYLALTPLAYDTTVLVGEQGNHFYLDPVAITGLDPEYHLRRLVLDETTPILANPTESWGRFRIVIDRLAVYGKGQPPRVVGISTVNHKFAVLEIPDAPYQSDSFANNAKILSGPGESNDTFVLNPTALTIASNGAILILQGETVKAVKAFDFDGKPWKFFSQGTSSVLPLVQDATSVTWLDISIDATNLVYVLSFAGGGMQQSDYRLDIYDASSGQRVVRNTGIAVGRMVVDRFRGLYSLNRETVKGSPIVEPSVSVWAPSAPQATARRR